MDDLDPLAERLIGSLLEKNRRILITETFTGGLIGHCLTNVKGASRVLIADLVLYSFEAKNMMLDIPFEIAETHGVVSEEIIRIMLNKMRGFGSGVNLALTGVADGTIEGVPRGTVIIGVEIDGSIGIEHYSFGGDRKTIKRKAAEAAILKTINMLEKLG